MWCKFCENWFGDFWEQVIRFNNQNLEIMHRNLRKSNLILLLLLIFGCNSETTIPDFSSDIDYSYKSIQYKGNPEKNDIISYKFFDSNGKLLEQIGNEYRIQYIYNLKGQLKEKLNCRMYNCDSGWREILIQDKYGNYIGSKNLPKNIKKIEPRKFEQIKFYDKNNKLIKELSDTGTNIEGNKWEKWIYYSYKKYKRIKEIEKSNGKIIWIGEYKYDSQDNLVSIERKNNFKFEIEEYQYDKQKRIIRESIRNDEELEDNVSFSAKNNSTIFKYDKHGKIVEETTFNHKGEKYRSFIYKYYTKQQ